MSFNRELLRNLNLDDKQIDLIMNEHGKTINEFKGQKAKLEETQSNLSQMQNNNDDLQNKINILLANSEELLKANQAMQAEHQELKAEQEKAKKQREHDEAVTKSLNSLGDGWDKQQLTQLFANAEIENGEIKGFSEKIETLKKLYVPQIKGGYKHLEGSSIAEPNVNAANVFERMDNGTASDKEYHDNFWAKKKQEYLNKT